MKDNTYKRYIVWGVTVFAVIALSILLFFILYRAKGLSDAFSNLINILKPIIYGAALAYIFNPIYRRCEQLLTRLFSACCKKQRWAIFGARLVSTILTLALTLVILFGLIYLVLPQLAVSVFGIIKRMPNYLTDIQAWFELKLSDNSYMSQLALKAYQDISSYVDSWLLTDMRPLLASWAAYAYTGLLNAVAELFNLLIGIVVMIYLLNGKRAFAAQSKKLLYSILGAERGNTVVETVRYAHRVFGGFINGKLLESLLVGLFCFIFMAALKMPYTMLISVIIGVTNVIPFFGPFIGAIPSALLLLVENPLLCLYFLIFILVLQQIMGNILGPRILGITTGLPSFWVLFSIVFFGRTFGFIGMVLGVPVFALIYSLLKVLIKRGLDKQKLPDDTASYQDLHHIEGEGHALVKNDEV